MYVLVCSESRRAALDSLWGNAAPFSYQNRPSVHHRTHMSCKHTITLFSNTMKEARQLHTVSFPGPIPRFSMLQPLIKDWGAWGWGYAHTHTHTYVSRESSGWGSSSLCLCLCSSSDGGRRDAGGGGWSTTPDDSPSVACIEIKRKN